MVLLQSLTAPELILPELDAVDRPGVLREVVAHLVDRGFASNAAQLYTKLQEREKLGSTGIGAGVAVPHCKCAGLEQVLVAVGISRQGIDFEAADGIPVKLVFVVLSPEDQPAQHLQSLAAISRWIRADDHLDRVLECRDPQAIFELLGEPSSEPLPSAAAAPEEPPVAR